MKTATLAYVQKYNFTFKTFNIQCTITRAFLFFAIILLISSGMKKKFNIYYIIQRATLIEKQFNKCS